jgi:hypothetical protein
MRFKAMVALAFCFGNHQYAQADGFKLKLVGNQIIAKNTEGTIPDELFGHAFDITNNTTSTYESSHGSVDANDAGSGFSFPSAGASDSFVFNIRGLWTFAGGVASPVPASGILQILKTSDRSPIAQLEGSNAAPPGFSIAATTSHELLWTVPQSSPVKVWGLAYSVTGVSAVTGLPFKESPTLVSVQWTPDFQGDPDAAMQAIYAAVVPEPGAGALLWLGGLAVVRSPFRLIVHRSRR